jgi:hypothetical protein
MELLLKIEKSGKPEVENLGNYQLLNKHELFPFVMFFLFLFP